VTEAAVTDLAPVVGTAAACRAMGRSRATHYRRHRKSPGPPRPAPVPQRQRPQPHALTVAERAEVLGVLSSDRFTDAAPAQVWATLLDEGTYLASESTMYRLLRESGQSRERRRQARHPAHVKPELVATEPNQVWSWDIERHEALPNRAAMEGRRHRLVAASRP
jgi:putative transposase